MTTYLRELSPNGLTSQLSTPFETPGRDYHYQGIAKRSFNFGYKVAPRFNLSKAEAEMENGLLNITVPYSSNVTSVKTVKIK